MNAPAIPVRARNRTGFGQFFRYHGWLAPGIRLFRRLGFPAKAMLICAAFMVPLLLLLGMHWSETRSQIVFAQSEREGLRVTRPLLAVVHAAQNRRRAATAKAPDLAQAQDKVREAFDTLLAGSGASLTAFKLGDTLDTLRRSHQALLDKPVHGSPDDTFRAHSDFIDAALGLLREVANASQLVLDPELDTYHMMAMSVLRAPMQQENTGRLRGLGNLVLREGQLTPERRELLLRWEAIWDFLDREVEDAYQEGIAKFPDIAARFDMKGTDVAADAFHRAVRAQILGESLSGDAKTFLALGNAAVDKQTELAAAVRDRLDERLAQRIAALNTALAAQMGASIACMLLAGYLMLSFYKVMLGGLHEVSSHLKAITHGNLTTVPHPWGRDEAAELMLDLGAMQRALRQVVSTVLDGSSQVRTASQEISTATGDLSRRSEQAAADLQETAARTEQISSTVRQTTQTVHSAKNIVNANAEAARRGGQVIENVVATMGGIRTASGRIGEIIGVIDGIAFQ